MEYEIDLKIIIMKQRNGWNGEKWYDSWDERSQERKKKQIIIKIAELQWQRQQKFSIEDQHFIPIIME